MPTYEYGCEACGNQWELEQRISADPIKECPKCGEEKARRLISGGNFILKGSGWYADLYHKPAGGGSKASSDSSSSSGASTSSDSSSSTSSPPSSPSSSDKKVASG